MSGSKVKKRRHTMEEKNVIFDPFRAISLFLFTPSALLPTNCTLHRTQNLPIGSKQLCAFSFSAMRGLMPPSQAIGLVDIDSTPPASPTE